MKIPKDVLTEEEMERLFSGEYLADKVDLERTRDRLWRSWMYVHQQGGEGDKRFERALGEIDRQLDGLRGTKQEQTARYISLMVVIFTAICMGLSNYLVGYIKSQQDYIKNKSKVEQIVNAEILENLTVANEYVRGRNQIVSDVNFVNFIRNQRFYTGPLRDLLANNFQYLENDDVYYLANVRDKLDAVNAKLDIIEAKYMNGPRISTKPECAFIYLRPEEKRDAHGFLNDDFNRFFNNVKKLSFFQGNPYTDLKQDLELTDGQISTFYFSYSSEYLDVKVDCN
jgi:hypothetical protein